VREAIFSALEARDLVRDASVLDLYAGSGALGLEAASRGARHVTLVDQAPTAVRACRHNAVSLAAAARRQGIPAAEVTVSARSAVDFLQPENEAIPQWDLVFLDPPYRASQDAVERVLGLASRVITPEATLLLERSTRDSATPEVPGLDVLRRSTYGETVVWWLGLAAVPPPASR
jgi:16S rRNA (guanine966-N2)-methyltransferase